MLLYKTLYRFPAEYWPFEVSVNELLQYLNQIY